MSIFFTSLVLIIIILFITLVFRFGRRLLSPGLSGIAILAYCAVLILATVIVNLLPTDNLIQKYSNGHEYNNEYDLYSPARQNILNLLRIAEQGGLDSSPGIYKKASHRYEVAGDHLILALDNNLGCEIFVHRKPSDDKTIETASYVTSYIVQNTDVTEHILPPVFSLSGNTLTITPPDRYTLEYVSFKKDLTSVQFSASPDPDPFRNSAFFGGQAVYLSIPKNMQIEAGQHSIIYLNSNG